MSASTLPENFQDEDFSREGLYLFFTDGQCVRIVRDEIEKLSEEYWQDPHKIHPLIKELPEFLPCGHCPHYGEQVFCIALRPILPYLNSVDQYMSYDRVTAVFSAGGTGEVSVSETSTQQALKYVAILSLIFYCEMGERYRGYFADVNPLMSPDEISTILHRNIRRRKADHPADLTQEMATFEKEVMESAQCLTKRLRLICRNDAFINAFSNAQLALQMLLLHNETDRTA